MIENAILTGLVSDINYARTVVPHIKREYFGNIGEQIVYSIIRSYFVKYNKIPSKTEISIELDNKQIKENLYEQAKETIDEIKTVAPVDYAWLCDNTETWCKKRAFYNAILESSNLLEHDNTDEYHKALGKVTDALSVTFDTNIGSEYFESAEERYESRKRGVTKLPTLYNIFNKVTKGGFVCPSFILFVAPTGVGKSLMLCNMAASLIRQGKNVLYISMEMSEQQIEERIDLNLLDLREDQIDLLSKNQYMEKLSNLKKNILGKLISKMYPAKSAHAGHFRYLLEELKMKQGITPDAIIIDYLNICSPIGGTKGMRSDEIPSNIAIELRAIGQEYKIPVFSATQTNREGTKAIDFDTTDIGQSWDVAAHCDYIYGLIETEELAKMGQMRIKRLKDRYNEYRVWYSSFIIGVDKSKQKIYDIDERDMPDDYDVEDRFSEMMV